jgi:hypothetical protein
MLRHSGEVIQEPQLTSTKKHDKKKNKYIRGKKQYENNQVEKLEELGQKHETRQFYRNINKLRKD